MLTVRLCFVDFDGGALLEEVRALENACGVDDLDARIDEVIERYAGHVYEGVGALARWVGENSS